MKPSLCQCGRPKPNAAHVTCAPCWLSLPIELRRPILRLNSRKATKGSPEHIAAIRAALTHLKSRH